MNRLTGQERAAIQAVVRAVSTKWKEGSDPADARVVIGGRRIALRFTTLDRRGGRGGSAVRPRLRFDKVATRVIERLRAVVSANAPDGTIVVVTITAPIRLASKTAAVIENRIRDHLGRRSPARSWKATVHGNRVRIRILEDASERGSKLIGFVHDADSDPLSLQAMTREFIEITNFETAPRARRGGNRWLIVRSARGSSFLEVYRCICSQLRGHSQPSSTSAFRKIVIVFEGDRVETLAG